MKLDSKDREIRRSGRRTAATAAGRDGPVVSATRSGALIATLLLCSGGLLAQETSGAAPGVKGMGADEQSVDDGGADGTSPDMQANIRAIRFGRVALDLGAFERPSRSIRRTGDRLRLTAAGYGLADATLVGGAMAYASAQAFDSMSVSVEMSERFVEADPGSYAGLRIALNSYQSTDAGAGGDGSGTTSIRTNLFVGDRGNGREVWATMEADDGTGTTVIDERTVSGPGVLAGTADTLDIVVQASGDGAVSIDAGFGIARLEGPAAANGARTDIEFAAVIGGTADEITRVVGEMSGLVVNGVTIDPATLLPVEPEELANTSIDVNDGRLSLAVEPRDERRHSARAVTLPLAGPTPASVRSTISLEDSELEAGRNSVIEASMTAILARDEGASGPGRTGDLVFSVGLSGDPDRDPQPFARVTRLTDQTGETGLVLFERVLPGNVILEERQDMSIVLDGDKAIFSFDDGSFAYSLPALAGDPSSARLALAVTTDDVIGRYAARFDDLFVDVGDNELPAGTDDSGIDDNDSIDDQIDDSIGDQAQTDDSIDDLIDDSGNDQSDNQTDDGVTGEGDDDKGSVAGLRVKVYSSTVAEVFWDRSFDAGTSYAVLLDDQVNSQGDFTSDMLRGLSPGTNHAVTVVRRNATGEAIDEASVRFDTGE